MNVAVKKLDIEKRIARIEAELVLLKRDVEALPDDDDARTLTTADLLGAFKGKMDLSLEEIKEFEYKSKLEKSPDL